MQNSSEIQENIPPDVSFGLTEEDLKNRQVKTFLNTIKNFLMLIVPTILKMLTILLYYFLKLVKSFFKIALQMIKGEGE